MIPLTMRQHWLRSWRGAYRRPRAIISTKKDEILQGHLAPHWVNQDDKYTLEALIHLIIFSKAEVLLKWIMREWWPSKLYTNINCHKHKQPHQQIRARHTIFITIDGVNTTINIILHNANFQGAVSIRKTVLPGMAIPMLKIRRPYGRLIFNMEIAIRR